MFQIWVAFYLLAIGSLGFLTNIYSGFLLVGDSGLSPYQHLATALGSILAFGLGFFFLVRTTGKKVEALQKEWLLNSPQRENPIVRKVDQSRKQAIIYSASLLGLSLVSIVSGTISQAGRFPLVHGICGFGVAITGLFSISIWLRLITEFPSNSSANS